MGTWSSTEPTLPQGSSWSAYTATTYYATNHWKNTISIRIARLVGRQIVVGVRFVQSEGTDGDWYAPAATVFTPRVGSTNEDTTSLTASKTTRYRYYTTEADAGETIRITAKVTGSAASSIYRNITVPAIVGYPIYVYDGSGWAGSVSLNTQDGSWKENVSISVYDGSWKEA